jgi:aerobic carbon-monoxide dehydrogenase medium subunit
MHGFELLEPRSLAEACAVIASDTDAKPIAGGTALLTIIRQRLLRPKRLVNLSKIRDGSAISFDPQKGMRIGALATINEIETSSAGSATLSPARRRLPRGCQHSDSQHGDHWR